MVMTKADYLKQLAKVCEARETMELARGNIIGINRLNWQNGKEYFYKLAEKESWNEFYKKYKIIKKW